VVVAPGGVVSAGRERRLPLAGCVAGHGDEAPVGAEGVVVEGAERRGAEGVVVEGAERRGAEGGRRAPRAGAPKPDTSSTGADPWI
jgi:hypothetical protein